MKIIKKIAAVFLVFVLFLLCACQTAQKQAEKKEVIFGTVGGEEITQTEFNYFKAKERSNVMTEFAREFDISDFSSFWDETFDGRNPADELDERAFALAVKAKLALLEAKKMGQIADVSWDALKSLAEEYNRTHKSGAVGVKSISMDSFYDYYVENAKISIENSNGVSADEFIEDLYKNAEIVRFSN